MMPKATLDLDEANSCRETDKRGLKSLELSILPALHITGRVDAFVRIPICGALLFCENAPDDTDGWMVRTSIDFFIEARTA